MQYEIGGVASSLKRIFAFDDAKTQTINGHFWDNRFVECNIDQHLPTDSSLFIVNIVGR